MTRENFDRELDEIRQKLFQVTEKVRKNLNASVKYLENRDMKGAAIIVEADEIVNLKCLEIEEQCLNVIATQQPVATDLRLLFSILQITTEVERIGDYAKGIARISMKIGSDPLIKPLIDIPRMEEIAGQMLDDAIRAFTEDDADTARLIPARDLQIDILYGQIHRELITFVMQNPSNIEQSMMLDWVAHNLERVGDRVINICERVIFTVTGVPVDLN
jgi:phosphate transport system protein